MNTGPGPKCLLISIITLGAVLVRQPEEVVEEYHILFRQLVSLLSLPVCAEEILTVDTHIGWSGGGERERDHCLVDT